jgi:hypothetical protein
MASRKRSGSRPRRRAVTLPISPVTVSRAILPGPTGIGPMPNCSSPRAALTAPATRSEVTSTSKKRAPKDA